MKNTFMLFAILVSSFSFAQIQPEPPYIEVTGTADKEIIPDKIYISIHLTERYDGKKNITLEEQDIALKKGLTKLGIDLKELSLSGANADYMTIKWKRKDALNQANYQLLVNNATAVSNVFQLLDELDIKNAYIEKVDHSKIEQLKQEVRIEAIKAAKQKADYLLTAINEKTGNALIVRENEQQYYPVYAANMRMDKRESSLSSNNEPVPEIEFQKIKINASVYVKFSIQK